MADFDWSHELCEKLARAAKDASDALKIPVTISIADSSGCLRYLHRFGSAILPSVEISQNKAYTAAVLGKTTGEFGEIAQPGAEAFGINMTHPKLVIFGGGFPLVVNGKTVGGVGISGGSVEEDETIGKQTVKAFLQLVGQ